MSGNAETPNRVLGDHVPMGAHASYPEALRKVVRWNTLVGSGSEGWNGVPQGDVRMGLLDLDPGGFYPSHAHPAPEIYYIVSGSAEWSVGDETFQALAGMAIYHAPNMPHRMVNTGDRSAPDGLVLVGPGRRCCCARGRAETARTHARRAVGSHLGHDPDRQQAVRQSVLIVVCVQRCGRRLG